MTDDVTERVADWLIDNEFMPAGQGALARAKQIVGLFRPGDDLGGGRFVHRMSEWLEEFVAKRECDAVRRVREEMRERALIWFKDWLVSAGYQEGPIENIACEMQEALSVEGD